MSLQNILSNSSKRSCVVNSKSITKSGSRWGRGSRSCMRISLTILFNLPLRMFPGNSCCTLVQDKWRASWLSSKYSHSFINSCLAFIHGQSPLCLDTISSSSHMIFPQSLNSGNVSRWISSDEVRNIKNIFQSNIVSLRGG